MRVRARPSCGLCEGGGRPRSLANWPATASETSEQASQRRHDHEAALIPCHFRRSLATRSAAAPSSSSAASIAPICVRHSSQSASSGGPSSISAVTCPPALDGEQIAPAPGRYVSRRCSMCSACGEYHSASLVSRRPLRLTSLSSTSRISSESRRGFDGLDVASPMSVTGVAASGRSQSSGRSQWKPAIAISLVL
eukprot:2047186-Prymnesium_polylepis.1